MPHCCCCCCCKTKYSRKKSNVRAWDCLKCYWCDKYMTKRKVRCTNNEAQQHKRQSCGQKDILAVYVCMKAKKTNHIARSLVVCSCCCCCFLIFLLDLLCLCCCYCCCLLFLLASLFLFCNCSCCACRVNNVTPKTIAYIVRICVCVCVCKLGFHYICCCCWLYLCS